MRIKILTVSLIIVLFGFPLRSRAAEPPAVTAHAAILMEAGSGAVLFGVNETQKIYPASMVKFLTALVAIEYLEPDELVVCGDEVSAVPDDSSKNGHFSGETISVMSLMRALLIAGGNETANTLALAAAKKASGDDGLEYPAAERYFCGLMNDKALELGAVNSNFTNPHGYHHANMFSTAYDIAVITRAAMGNDLIRRLTAETAFVGNGAEDAPDGARTKNYNWRTSNLLISPGDYFYLNATGGKTGRHSSAGDCITATASKGGTDLIAVVCNDPDPGRWLDAAALFEYGFNNYSKYTLHEPLDVIGEIRLDNPRKQDARYMEYLVTEPVEAFLNLELADALEHTVRFIPELIGYDEMNRPYLKTPVEEGQVLGSVTFTAGANGIYTGDIIASDSALTRTFATDVDYYIASVKSALFVREAVPYWIIAGLSSVIIGYVIFRIVKSRRRTRSYLRKLF